MRSPEAHCLPFADGFMQIELYPKLVMRPLLGTYMGDLVQPLVQHARTCSKIVVHLRLSAESAL